MKSVKPYDLLCDFSGLSGTVVELRGLPHLGGIKHLGCIPTEMSTTRLRGISRRVSNLSSGLGGALRFEHIHVFAYVSAILAIPLAPLAIFEHFQATDV